MAGLAESQTFEETYIELFVHAERVAGRILRNRAEAEDVAAETMVKAMSAWSRVRTYSVPWITRVATNLAIDIVRRRALAPPDENDMATRYDETDRLMLLAALAKLPSRQRQALVLFYVVGLTGPEAAEVMGLSAGTVKAHVRRGLAALRSQFGRELKEMTDAV